MSLIRRRCTQLLAIACSAIILSATLIVAIWFISGGRLYDVQTNSMSPTFTKNDAVLLSKTHSEQLEVGDIVTYRSGQNAALLVSHRIVKIDRARQILTTRGDRLAIDDPPVAASQIVGKVWAKAPGFGGLLTWVKRPIGLSLVLYLPATLLMAYELQSVVRVSQPTIYRLRARQ